MVTWKEVNYQLGYCQSCDVDSTALQHNVILVAMRVCVCMCVCVVCVCVCMCVFWSCSEQLLEGSCLSIIFKYL